MDAAISGSAGVAIVFQDDRIWSLHAHELELRAREEHEIRYLLGDSRDLRFLEDVDESQIREALVVARHSVVGLQLALMLCDPRASQTAVKLAVSELVDIIVSNDAVVGVESVLYATPLVPPLDAGTAVERAARSGSGTAFDFFTKLQVRSAAIQSVRRSWDILPASSFSDERRSLERAFTQGGVFRALVNAVYLRADLRQCQTQILGKPSFSSIEHGEKLLASMIRELESIPVMQPPRAEKAPAPPASAPPVLPPRTKNRTANTSDQSMWSMKHHIDMDKRRLVARSIGEGAPKPPQSSRVYVGNLSFATTQEAIRAAFQEIGEVTDVRLAMDRESGRPRGFGFVTMGTSEAAADAISRLQGTVLDGRPLRVGQAEEPRADEGRNNRGSEPRSRKLDDGGDSERGPRGGGRRRGR